MRTGPRGYELNRLKRHLRRWHKRIDQRSHSRFGLDLADGRDRHAHCPNAPHRAFLTIKYPGLRGRNRLQANGRKQHQRRKAQP
ncbi:hypothetical protein ACFSTD_15965 [Novosphingobium colocasiae]|uniref:hypothetical protein n=1 Tax=Novosphingobium colocasiae TaxID=1256513 RepID=UPI00167BDFFA|nr:hypothetical protein [Novosphingobium colocasiae]